MSWLKKNIWEIERSLALSYVGAILAFLHVLNYYFWKHHALLGRAAKGLLLCWDFTPHCGFTATHGLQLWLFHSYPVLAIVSLIVFTSRRLTGLAWSLLLFTFLLMLYFYIGNASLASDIHALFIVVNIGFLFIPRKLTLIRYSTLFYFFLSGLRELNPDWLSGKSLLPQLHLTLKGLEWVAALDILFKWALPPLLLSSLPQQFAIGVVALIAFLLVHYWYLHDFQSVVLVFFVVAFILDYFERKRLERESMYQSYAHPEPSKLWWTILFAVFIFAQTKFFKKLAVSQIIKIKGPAASIDCRQMNFTVFQNKIKQVYLPTERQHSDPLRCQQKMAEASVRALCADLVHQPGFQSLSTFLLTRSLTEARFHLIWQSDNVCAGGTP